MTTFTWLNAASGDWSDATQWSPSSGPPDNGADAVIDAGGFYFVTVDLGASYTLNSLDIAGGGVDLVGTLEVPGALTLSGGELFLAGTLQAATIEATGGTLVIAANATLGLNSGTIDIGDNSHLIFGGTQALDAALTLQQTGTGIAYIDVASQTYVEGSNVGLTNLGTIDADVAGDTFEVGSPSSYLFGDYPSSFTNAGLITVDEGDDFLVDTNYFSNTGSINVINGGTLTLDDITSTFTFDPFGVSNTTTWFNTGQITVTNATLGLYGDVTTAQLESDFTLSDATVDIFGTLDNTGATLSIGSGMALRALNLPYGGDIVGGVIKDGGGGLTFNNSGYYEGGSGTLDGVTYYGTLDLSAGSVYLDIADGITLKGAGGVGPGAMTLSGVSLGFITSATLDNATIDIESSRLELTAPGLDGFGYDNLTLTLGAGLTLQQTSTGTVDLKNEYNISYGAIDNLGTIYAGGASGLFVVEGDGGFGDSGSFTNAGLITVTNGDNFSVGGTVFSNTGSINVIDGGTLTLENGWSNTGQITVTGANLDLSTSLYSGFILTASLADFVLLNATVNILGYLDNRGATLSVGPGTVLGTLNLDGGDIIGGVIADGGGGLGIASLPYQARAVGSLDGVTYQGTLDLSGVTGVFLDIFDGITLQGFGGSGAGAINLGSQNVLEITSSATLDNATIDIGAYSYLELTESGGFPLIGGTLTLGAGLTLQQTGIGTAYLDDNSESGGGIINLGTINANVAGDKFEVDGGSFTNSGVIAVDNGDQFVVNTTNFINTGTFDLFTSSGYSSTNTLTNDGLVSIIGGTLATGGLTIDSTGTLFGNAVIAEPVTNFGTVTAYGGLMVLADGVNGPGTLRVDTASKMVLGASSSAALIKDYGTLQLEGSTYSASLVSVAAGALVAGLGTIDGTVVDNGAIEASGGLLVLNDGANGPGVLRIDAGAKLEFHGNTSVGRFMDSGTMQLLGFQLSLNNTSTIAAGGLLIGHSWVTNVLANSGTIEASGPGALTIGGAVTGAGTLRADAGGELDLRGPVAGKTLTDSGVVKLFGATASITVASVMTGGMLSGFGAFLAPLSDSGTVIASGGLLKLGAVFGSGGLAIGAGASLELAGASADAVTFEGVGSLLLDNAIGFTGGLGGLSLGDKIVFKELVTSATLNATDTSLTVVGSAGTTQYAVAGALAGTQFSLGTDQHTLTLAPAHA